ncbi:MAG: hypothetical protein ABIT83_22550 [Massilia sp.]
MLTRVPFTRRALAAASLLALCGAGAAAPKQADEQYRFAAAGNQFARPDGEARLKQLVADNTEAAQAFMVVIGIKGAAEPCNDKLYERRRELLDDARRPLIVAPAAADWSECKVGGRTVSAERLARWREIFAAEPATLGKHALPVSRLSNTAKFRSYAENAYWDVGGVLYATINLPSNNNHYRPEAGRNSEFEDRLVANRFWLHQLFAFARRDKRSAVVLFSDGDVKALSQPTGLRALLGRPSGSARDGYEEVRKQIVGLAQKFSGKVLLVDTAAPEGGTPAIVWRGRLGHLSVGSKVVDVRVDPDTTGMFTVRE